MQGLSDEMLANIAATGFDPADRLERTAYLLEQLAAEVRRFGVIAGSLSREREYAPDGEATGVQKISLNMRIDHGLRDV
jgi:hypothetical protein